MYTFRELQKASKMVSEEGLRIAVLGNTSTQFLSDAVRGYANLRGIPISLFDAHYDQIEEQLIDRESEVHLFQPNSILIWLSTEKLYEEFLGLPAEDREHYAEDVLNRMLKYWDLASMGFGARVLQPNFTEIDDKALGNFSCKVRSTFTFQMRKLNYLMQEKMAERDGIFPIDLLSIQIKLGRDRFYNAPLYYGAKMSISMDALPYAAKAVVDVVQAMCGQMRKCVVTDLDNTLWGGVIGDDGLGNIEIGELGKGRVYSNLQRYLKQLKNNGIILAVCSKNDEEAAREPFEKHDEMILRLSDISAFAANWEEKPNNLLSIQKALNIGMDSMVFLDDNPFEREMVRTILPQVLVPELPKDPAMWLTFLQDENYFETSSYAGNGGVRTRQYKAEFERKKAEESAASIDEYLESLEMIGDMRRFEPLKYSRIAELTQRSNQFNLRTIRYTADEIGRISEDKNCIGLYFTLRDKFGDHGLVSVVIIMKTGEGTAFIDTWLMSCRVLKRGMEEFVVNLVMREAQKEGIHIMTAEYIPTHKNGMVKEIYNRFGFNNLGDGQYKIEVGDYVEKSTHIQEVIK